ncbi:hypothetical protein DRO54_04480 [Candidatus Bathyarchaeota archaeon]|nr:MAG: hypothetical protein DRO54_04480 [Candidatus Bathyarchaeota archaeon]
MKSARREKIKFQLRRFKSFMATLFKNKKAATGVFIIIFFTIMAVVGPMTTDSDPIKPGSTDYGELPKAASLCLPSWYRLFNPNLTETMDLSRDPKFEDPNLITWDAIETSKESIKVEYSDFGHDNPGSTKIVFTEPGKAKLKINFEYPFSKPIEQFKIWADFYLNATIEKEIEITEAKVSASVYFQKDGKHYPILVPPHGLTFQFRKGSEVGIGGWVVVHNFMDSFHLTVVNYYKQTYLEEPNNVIFSSPANMSLVVEVTYKADESVIDEIKDVTFYVDNFYAILYGETFGLLGTDQSQRDIYAQLVYGARWSLIIGLGTAAISVLIGLIVGLLAGFLGGAVDEVLMRFTDMLLVLPTLPLLLILIFVLGQSMINIILVLTLLGWMGFARTVRSMVLSLKERAFIESARAAGASTGHIILRHIVPNVMSLVYISLAMSVPSAIVSEASLSWLGLGPLDVMTWGRILFEFNRSGLRTAGAFAFWYWTVVPGICIAALSLSFILIGYAMDEILNPKLRERR